MHCRWQILVGIIVLFFNTTRTMIDLPASSVDLKKSKKNIFVGDFSLKPLALKKTSINTSCRYCLKFISIKRLPAHIHCKHDQKQHCCGLEFTNTLRHVEHRQEKHERQIKYTCILCSVQFNDIQKYVQHCKNKLPERLAELKAQSRKRYYQKKADHDAQLPQLYKMSLDFILNQEIKVNHVL